MRNRGWVGRGEGSVKAGLYGGEIWLGFGWFMGMIWVRIGLGLVWFDWWLYGVGYVLNPDCNTLSGKKSPHVNPPVCVRHPLSTEFPIVRHYNLSNYAPKSRMDNGVSLSAPRVQHVW